MSDLIDRQAAIDMIEKYFNGLPIAVHYDMLAMIHRLPSVQPEIIRCRDCKHWDETWTNDWSPDYHYCPMIDGVRKGDFYCADAERRTDG